MEYSDKKRVRLKFVAKLLAEELAASKPYSSIRWTNCSEPKWNEIKRRVYKRLKAIDKGVI